MAARSQADKQADKIESLSVGVATLRESLKGIERRLDEGADRQKAVEAKLDAIPAAIEHALSPMATTIADHEKRIAASETRIKIWATVGVIAAGVIGFLAKLIPDVARLFQ